MAQSDDIKDLKRKVSELEARTSRLEFENSNLRLTLVEIRNGITEVQVLLEAETVMNAKPQVPHEVILYGWSNNKIAPEMPKKKKTRSRSYL
jgi:regulator of replication initiation timing